MGLYFDRCIIACGDEVIKNPLGLCVCFMILYVIPHPQLVAMATLNLASKVQEHNTKLGDVVNTCHRYTNAQITHPLAEVLHCPNCIICIL